MELKIKLIQILPKEETPKSYNGKVNFEFDRKNINDLLESYEESFDELLNTQDGATNTSKGPLVNMPKQNDLEVKILSLYETFSGQTNAFPKYEDFVEVLFFNPIYSEYEAQFTPFIDSIVEMTQFDGTDLVKLTVNGDTFDKYTVNEVKNVLSKYVFDRDVNFDLENVKANLFEYLNRKGLSFEKDGRPNNHYIVDIGW